MPLNRRTEAVGIYGPRDVEFLRRVFDATAVSGESEEQRERRAELIVSYFTAGHTDEGQLIELVKFAS
jgi:hypothetical protein